MQQAVAARTPAHLWIVGILSLLWNGFGAYDYLMTRMRKTELVEAILAAADRADAGNGEGDAGETPK